MSLYRFGSASHVGQVRKHNEDCLLSNPEIGLWLVADGMGGHAAGEIASAIVAKTVNATVQNGETLTTALKAAHQAIVEAAHAGAGGANMGSTCVTTRIHNNRYETAWVGDSRAYLWNGELHLISHDHSYVQGLVDTGAIDSTEARIHPSRNVLTRCLGGGFDSDIEVSISGGWLFRGDRIMLCSDGLTGEVSDDEISYALSSIDNDQVAVDCLVKLANDRGGEDNITIIIISAPATAPLRTKERQYALKLSKQKKQQPPSGKKKWFGKLF